MLQIRNLPDDVYHALLLRAQKEHRSLAQQAVVELSRMPTLLRRRSRLQTLGQIRRSIEKDGYRRLDRQPEALIREDRER